MRTISAVIELSKTISSYKRDGKSIGLVPTMGALHDGHLSLVRRAKRENDVVVVSIFVNPLQFNNEADLNNYPRVIEEDVELLKQEGVDVVFSPEVSELYPDKPIISIDFGEMANKLEGKYRQGHFEGVGIVVSKLLHLTSPTKAYFGLKDLQQFILIRRMCLDLGFPSEIIGVPTVRESSGLALSSRNRLLTRHGKEVASILNKGLERIEKGLQEGRSLDALLAEANEFYTKEPQFDLEYLEAVDPSDFSQINDSSLSTELAVCIAGYVEGVRLIDNLYLRLK